MENYFLVNRAGPGAPYRSGWAMSRANGWPLVPEAVTGADGSPTLAFYDGAGRVIWKAP